MQQPDMVSCRLSSEHSGSRRSRDAVLQAALGRAVMLMMRRTVVDGVSTCTGRAAPNNTGPIAMPPPAAVLSRLYEMLAASMLGITSRLASPVRVELGIRRAR
jgi:hypothetical protein